MDNTDAEVIEQTREVIETRGWCQNRIQEDDGRVCLRGAFMAAILGTDDVKGAWRNDRNYGPAWDRMRAIEQAWIEPLIPTQEGAFPEDAVVYWNNDFGRLQDEVLDVLTKAAHNAREGIE